MPEIQTQFDSDYENAFMQLFDDIFSTHEESMYPLSKIRRHNGLKNQKEKRQRLVEKMKQTRMSHTVSAIHENRAISEKPVPVKIAREVLESNRPVENAYSPVDIHIPNYNLKRTMHEWGMGGPTSRQYQLLGHIINLPRNTAKFYYLGMISSYIAFRENWKSFVRVDDDQSTALNQFSFTKPEENVVVEIFLPKTPVEEVPDEHYYADGPSIGTIFLGLDYLTAHNKVFKTFVAKTMCLDTRVREQLASNYLSKRMFDLNVLFIKTKLLKYNYFRIVWERKFFFMDDYMICLVLFIRDNTSNITWEEVEETIYSKAREILRRGYKVSYDAAILEHERRFSSSSETC